MVGADETTKLWRPNTFYVCFFCESNDRQVDSNNRHISGVRSDLIRDLDICLDGEDINYVERRYDTCSELAPNSREFYCQIRYSVLILICIKYQRSNSKNNA